MPSYARKHQLSDSLVYHVYNRSSNQVPIFRTEEDFQCFKTLLRKYTARFLLKIYHWVIMQNHFHLLIELQDPERISQIMAGLNRAYTHYYHGRYKSVGYLWQGRFKSQAVQKEDYMVSCARYIERNPVKAGIVTDAWMYPHSSAQFYCFGIEDEITNESPVFLEFGCDKKEREAGYRKFLSDFDIERDKLFDEMENPIGDKEFLRRLVLENGRILPRRKGKSGILIA